MSQGSFMLESGGVRAANGNFIIRSENPTACAYAKFSAGPVGKTAYDCYKI